jgi:hypothetical protein
MQSIVKIHNVYMNIKNIHAECLLKRLQNISAAKYYKANIGRYRYAFFTH